LPVHRHLLEDGVSASRSSKTKESRRKLHGERYRE
jgi:hypothetical protein